MPAHLEFRTSPIVFWWLLVNGQTLTWDQSSCLTLGKEVCNPQNIQIICLNHEGSLFLCSAASTVQHTGGMYMLLS